MKQNKFKHQLVEKVIADEKEKQLQEKLHKKYDIPDEDVVVVEKNNTIKFLTKTLIGIIRFIAITIIFVLSIIGLASIIYPDSRLALINHWHQTVSELLKLIS